MILNNIKNLKNHIKSFYINKISFIFELSNKLKLFKMKAKKDIIEGFKTKAAEIFIGSPINVRVDFYCGSYSYREPKFFTVEGLSSFEEIRKTVKSLLCMDKKQSSSLIDDTFWATLTPELEHASGEWKYTRYDLSLYRVIL